MVEDLNGNSGLKRISSRVFRKDLDETVVKKYIWNSC